MKNELYIGAIAKKVIKQWYVVIGFILLFVAAVFIAQHYVMKPQFESNVELLVLPQKGEMEHEANDANIRLNIQLMNTYMNVMKSSNTLSSVKKTLNLSESVESLRKKMVVSSDENSLSVNIKVRASTAEKSQNIADTIAKTTQYKMKVYFPGNEVVILNPATTGKLISDKIYYIIAGFIGLWAGILLVIIEVMIARVVRDETDLSTFDFPVLGVIAYSEKKKERIN